MINERYILKYWHTIRHYKPYQLVGKISAHLGRAFGIVRYDEPPSDLNGDLVPSVPFPKREDDNHQGDIREGRFQFLNSRHSLGRPIDWSPEAPYLWKLNLHYFNYLPNLEISLQQELCREWISANPPGTQPGWHPYPTSLRIINWCKASFKEIDILQSLYQQASYLYNHLETYHLGNHLLENARALVFAGQFFNGQGNAQQWLERGIDIYREQTPEQILNDGAHFERSPMYHGLMLEGYLDVLNLLSDSFYGRSSLAETAKKMCDFLFSLTYPNGKLVLFNDSARGVSLSARKLHKYSDQLIECEPSREKGFPEAGYYIHHDDNCYLAFDGGKVGPDHLMGHGHADIFSYVLSVGGELFIVDTGVYEYRSGQLRDYSRSTRAHNTVCVDGVSQVECWDSFRVARRFRPRGVSVSRYDERTVFEGTFDGYAELIGDEIRHKRRLEIKEDERTIEVVDELFGKGQHSLSSRLHLHPDCQVVRDGDTFLIVKNEQTVNVDFRASQATVEQGLWFPEFGIKERRSVLVLSERSNLPSQVSYEIYY